MRAIRTARVPILAAAALATATLATAQSVTNTNTAEVFASLSAAVADADTLAGHTLEVSGDVVEGAAVAVSKAVAVTGTGATPSVEAPSFTFSAAGASVTGLLLQAPAGGGGNLAVCSADTTFTNSTLLHATTGNNTLVANGGTITLDATTVQNGVRAVNVNIATVVIQNGSVIRDASGIGVAASNNGSVVTITDSSLIDNATGADPAPGAGQYGAVVMRATEGPASITMTNTSIQRGASLAPAIAVSVNPTSASGPCTVTMTGGSITGGSVDTAVGIVNNTEGWLLGAGSGVADVELSGLTAFENPGGGPSVHFLSGTLLVENMDLPQSAIIFPGQNADIGNAGRLGGDCVATFDGVETVAGAASRSIGGGASAYFIVDSSQVTIRNSTIAPPGDANGGAVRLFTGSTQMTQVFDTTFGPPAGANGALLVQAFSAPITLTDCTFTSGLWQVVSAIDTANVELVNPTFLGQVGGVTLDMQLAFGTPGGVITLRGTDAQNKLDLTGTNCALLARGYHGTFNFIDVKADDQFGLSPHIGDVSLGTLLGPVEFNFERCDFRSGAGAVIPQASGGDFGVTINATNTVWQGPINNLGAYITGAAGAQTQPTTVNLVHCTIDDPAPNVFVDLNAGRGDVFNADYSVFEQGTANGFSGTIGLSSTTTNIVNGTVTFPSLPAGTLQVDPLLDASARLMMNSPALNAAAGTSTTDDVDGDPRPLGPGPDLGADESDFSNVTGWDSY